MKISIGIRISSEQQETRREGGHYCRRSQLRKGGEKGKWWKWSGMSGILM